MIIISPKSIQLTLISSTKTLFFVVDCLLHEKVAKIRTKAWLLFTLDRLGEFSKKWRLIWNCEEKEWLTFEAIERDLSLNGMDLFGIMWFEVVIFVLIASRSHNVYFELLKYLI